MSYLEKIDHYLDSLKIGKSALVDSWFMMSSPLPIVSVVIAYLVLIRLGPRVMRNRSPLKITKLMGYYNAAQVMLSLMICFKTLRLQHLFRDGILYIGCRYPSNTQNYQLLDMGWWYFFAKFTELLDTLFFILRKKEKQVTFLHVYHHAVMTLYSWSYLKYAAGGEGAILGFLNSAVHAVMYTYYLLAGLGPNFQKYLWWKKYVTKMQLAQFIIMLLYCFWTHHSPRCQYAPGFTYFITGNVIIFLSLFLNFYSKSYKKKSAETEVIEEYKKMKNELRIIKERKANGVQSACCALNENYICKRNCKCTALEELMNATNESCDNYVKNGEVSLCRRIVTTTNSGAEYNFDGIISK